MNNIYIQYYHFVQETQNITGKIYYYIVKKGILQLKYRCCGMSKFRVTKSFFFFRQYMESVLLFKNIKRRKT